MEGEAVGCKALETVPNLLGILYCFLTAKHIT
jgi:hypothetical protein